MCVKNVLKKRGGKPLRLGCTARSGFRAHGESFEREGTGGRREFEGGTPGSHLIFIERSLRPGLQRVRVDETLLGRGGRVDHLELHQLPA